MRKDKIIFICKEKGNLKTKEVDRQLLYDLMEAIKNSFSEDNEISKKLLSYIPELDEIQIDKERNNQLDVPYIICKIQNKSEIVEIRRHHKIMWSILEKYMQE